MARWLGHRDAVTWRIGTVAGIVLRLHPAALAFAGYMLATGHGGMLAAALVSVLLHEAAHAACACVLGWPPQAMELSPLGAVLCLDEEAEMPGRKRLLMLLAGPAMTLALAALAYHLTRIGTLPREIGRAVFLCNVALLLLNMLPVLPLDGGRLMAMLLERLLPRRTARKCLRVLGVGTGLLLIGANLLVTLRRGGLNLSLTFAGCWLCYAAAAGTAPEALEEVRQLQARGQLLRRHGVLRVWRIAVTPETPLRHVVRHLPARAWAEVVVVDPQTGEERGHVGEGRLVAAYLESPGDNCSCLADKTCQRLRL